MAARYLIGIDLGGTNLKVALLDLNYKIKSKQFLPTQSYNNKEKLINAICYLVNKIIKDNYLNKKDIYAIGIGLPGPIDAEHGVVHSLTNIAGWRNVKLRNILEKKLALKVFIDNDVKVMTLAEFKLGSARKFKNSLCLTLGTGVGGAFILDGKIFRGTNNAAGEIGHLLLNEDGPKCNCGGKACLETYIGNSRIQEFARKVFKRNITLEEVSLLAKKQNKLAIDVWKRVGFCLGLALTGVTNILNLDAVVIGGGVSKAGKILFDEVRKTIRSRGMHVQAKHVKVLKAKLGNEAGFIGAAILAREGF
ncbi:MAG: ROK family protein [Candidatus Omnitrophica bacterium]|nr:ROK family protein [Candidatus Omnitrophota bacterium]